MPFVLLDTVQDGDERYLDWLLSGLGWTLALTLTGWCIAFVIGVLVGSARTSQHRSLAIAGRLYVEVFRAPWGCLGAASCRRWSVCRSTPRRAWPNRFAPASRPGRSDSGRPPRHSA